jgi:hypothetical protein
MSGSIRRALNVAALGLALLGLGACVGETEGDDSGAGGASIATGGVGLGGAASGGSLAATGGSSAGSGGSESGETGGTGSGGLAGCAPVELSRVLPRVGQYMYGPDPGPCSQTASDGSEAVFAYEDGLVSASSEGDGETYERDASGRLAKVESPVYSATFTWSEGEVLEQGTTQTAQ